MNVMFEDITGESGIATIAIPNRNQRLGVAWGDLNGDLLPDIFIANHEKVPPVLYQNDSDGTFSDVSTRYLPAPVIFQTLPSGELRFNDLHGIQWVDYDNDGDQDLYIAEGTLFAENTNQLLINSIGDGGRLVERGSEVGIDYRARAIGALWLDFDQDGQLDLLATSRPKPGDRPTPPTLFRQTIDGFENVGISTIPDLVTSETALLSDLSGDGVLDLVVIGNTSSISQAKVIVYDITTRPFMELSLGELNTTTIPLEGGFTPAIRDLASADFNGDLRPDLYISRTVNNGQVSEGRLFINTDQGLVDQTEVSGLRPSLVGSGAVAADFDNDGDVDLYTIDFLHENQGDGTFISIPDARGAAFPSTDDITAVTTVDYDVDGFIDLFVTALPAPGRLLRNQGNGNHWLEIDLEGTISNRDGIGASVYVTAGGKTQLREQSGGVHKWSQNHQRLHFGIGDNTVIDTIEIRWPSGRVQHFDNVAADRLIQIVEGSDTINIGSGNGTPSTINGTSSDNILIGTSRDDTVIGFRGQDTLRGGNGNDTLQGGAQEDILHGENGDDVLRGGSERDVLHGGNGNDKLNAGSGKDVLFGGPGQDWLTGGGRGVDLFRFTAPNEGRDVITDFDPSEDMIQVSPKRFVLSRGVLEQHQFVLGTGAADRSDRFIYDQNSGNLYFDIDGNGDQDQILIATLTNKPNLVSSNIQAM